MDTLDANLLQNADAGLDAESRTFLLNAAKWARFLSIVGLVICSLMVIGAIMASFFASTIWGFVPQMNPMEGITSVIFLIFFLSFLSLVFFPIWYLFQFSTKTIAALSRNDSNLTEGFKNLKSFFKFYGIMAIIVLGFYALVFLGALLAGGLNT